MRSLLAGLLLLTGACREGERQVVENGLSLRYLPGCAPEQLERLSVEPLGDFAAGEESLLSLPIAAERPSPLAGLPADAAWFRLGITTERYRGFALVEAGRDQAQLSALLLPLARACAVLDAELGVLRGAALTVSPQGDLLWAGGLAADGQGALNHAFRLQVAPSQRVPLSEGLFVPRAYAAAARSGDESWVVGGAPSLREGSSALDTFERYSHVEERFVGLGRLASPRMEVSAQALSDGSVLLVGGREAAQGEPLDSLELLRGERPATPLRERLPWPALQPTLALRDDGRVLVLHSEQEQARLALVDVAAGAVEALPTPSLPVEHTFEPALAVALPGARVALFERGADGLSSGRVALIMPDGAPLWLSEWLGSFAGMHGLSALALRDGRVLLAGLLRDQPALRILDPGSRAVSARPLDLPVQALRMRPDGSVLLVGERGLRILREDALSPFDNPAGTLLADDSGVLCLDAHGRFTREGLALRANVADARFDIAPLRFRAVHIQLHVSGPAELLLRREDGAERVVSVAGQRVGPAFCQLDVAADQPISIVRDEQHITLRAGQSTRRCVLDGLTGPVALAVRALAPDVLVRDLRVTRR